MHARTRTHAHALLYNTNQTQYSL